MEAQEQDNTKLTNPLPPRRKVGRPRKSRRVHPFYGSLNPAANRKRRTTEYLIRHIVTDLNRTLTARQIGYFHGVTRAWVFDLANRLRTEGFKIPRLPPGRLRNTRVIKLISKFKRENPDLLKGKISSTIFVDDKTYYLNTAETARLIKFLPKIAEAINVRKAYGFSNVRV